MYKGMSRKVIFEDLGRIRYKQAWEYQEKLFAQVIRDKQEQKQEKEQYLLFCEHEHVYTLGKSGKRQNLLITRQMCESRQIDLHEIDRGGDITYHGPGQLVAYPIIDLEAFGIGIRRYISLLEDVVIETLKPYGIKGEKDEKAMGVWIDLDDPLRVRKICAIGVRASRFVTMHGLALNINSDLTYFNFINPCGFTDKGVTSMQKELGEEVDFREVSYGMKRAFRELFDMDLTDQRKPHHNPDWETAVT
jgi:lipoyl(octanoyl) transferase